MAERMLKLPYLKPDRGDTGALDLTLIAVTSLLAGVGLIMVASASMGVADVRNGSEFYYALRQGAYLCGGLILVLMTLLIPMKQWLRISVGLLFLSMALLVLVLLIGPEINGSKRWIPLGFFNFQASEVAKFCVVVYLASYLARRQDEVRTGWWGFGKPLMMLMIVMYLLYSEPDFGSMVVLMGTVMGMIFLAGAGLKQFAVLIMLSACGLSVIAVSQQYRIDRLMTYLDPWGDQYGAGYQLTQSLIAYGRGGWFGEGLGNSIQKLFYLPEAHTDFIFSILAEELGLFGSMAVIALLFFVICRGLSIGFKAEAVGHYFSAYLAYGIALLFGSQVFINIGVSSGLLPTKGLALPFLSYGGSSLLMNFLGIGILMRIDYERRHEGSGAVKEVRHG